MAGHSSLELLPIDFASTSHAHASTAFGFGWGPGASVAFGGRRFPRSGDKRQGALQRKRARRPKQMVIGGQLKIPKPPCLLASSLCPKRLA